MTPEQLKASVLQYAMQGKLVPQDPTDEPTSELIKRIQAEKEQLIKEKKIKKEMSLPEITDEEKPFEIPESWEWARLREITKIIGDGLHGTPSYDEKGSYYFINGSNLKEGKIIISDATKKVDYDEYHKNKKLMDDGTILLSINGTLGNLAIYNNEKVMLGKSAAYMTLICKLTVPYIYKYLSSSIFKQYYSEKYTGTTIKNIPLSALRMCVLPLPPMEEQKRIVQKIEELFKKIDQYAESYNKLEELNKQFPVKMEKSLLQYAMQGKLVPQNPSDEPASELLKQIKAEKEQLIKDKEIKKEKPLPEITDEEIPFEIPEGWEWVRLGTISEKIHYGYTASAIDKGNSKFVRITDIHNNKVDWDSVPYCNVEKEKMNNLKLSKGDILIARTGGTIGKSFLLPEIKHDAVFASYLIRVKLVNKEMSKFIQLYLNSPLYWGLLSAISFGTGQPNVNATNLSLLTVPIPPSNEQSIISRKVESLFEISRKLN